MSLGREAERLGETDEDSRAILRVSRDKAHPYTIINNTPLRDTRLSWKARGLLGYLLTMPDDWQVRMSHLMQQSPGGRDATYGGLRELAAAGYVRRLRVRDARGRIARVEYQVFEVPPAASEPAGPGPGPGPRPPRTGKACVDGSLGAQALHPRTGFPDTAFPDRENPPLLSTDRNEGLRDNKQRTGAGPATDGQGAVPPAVPLDASHTEGAPAASRVGPDPERRHVAAGAAPAVPARDVVEASSVGGDGDKGAAPALAAAAARDAQGPAKALDLAAVCAAYRAITGQGDLGGEALDAVARQRSLTAAYVSAKLDLLRHALAAGSVRNPRGFLIAALKLDWTPDTAPRVSPVEDAGPASAPSADVAPAAVQPGAAVPEPTPALPARGVAPLAPPLPERAEPDVARARPEPEASRQAVRPAAATGRSPALPEAARPDGPLDSSGADHAQARVEDGVRLTGALTALGVSASVARRLVREDPAGVAQQLAWLPHRQAQDPAALVVRAVQGHWSEPAPVREARLEAARWREQQRWADDLERARVQSQAPEARRRGRAALAQMRAMLAARGCGPVPPAAAGEAAPARLRGCG